MPIDVDLDERLKEIALATLTVMRTEGAAGLTIRAVAKALGGSTTLVTNYLPSRSALLMNVIGYVVADWNQQLRDALDGVPDEQRLAATAAWSVSTEPLDPVIRRLFLELLSRSGDNAELLAALRADTDEQMADLRASAVLASAADPDFVADVLHLALRGFYLTTIESPEVWNTDKATPIILRLVKLLLAAQPEDASGR